MDETTIRAALAREGFTGLFVWRDAPGATYPEHTHGGETAHVVLDGEITILAEGETRTYRAGDRFDVPAGQVHAARVGPGGCRYVVGER